MHINIECKATCTNIDAAEQKLLLANPVYKGEDHQIDTYYNTPIGRLKLREGTIENALIHYERSNTANTKQSNVILYQHQPNDNLKAILEKTLGVKIVVDKKRKIYFIDNVKFHFDRVEGLGTFIEIEAIAMHPEHTAPFLQQQCDYYVAFLGIQPDDFIAVSYSDMIVT